MRQKKKSWPIPIPTKKAEKKVRQKTIVKRKTMFRYFFCGFFVGPNPSAAAMSICIFMCFLIQLIAKIDSPLLSSFSPWISLSVHYFFPQVLWIASILVKKTKKGIKWIKISNNFGDRERFDRIWQRGSTPPSYGHGTMRARPDYRIWWEVWLRHGTGTRLFELGLQLHLWAEPKRDRPSR